MMTIMVATFTTQIEIDSQSVAWIAGTRTKVLEIVLDKTTHGWSPEEIHFQHPHLSLAQIHAALTYYYENQTECDRQMAASRQEAEALAAGLADGSLHERLRGMRSAQ